jgi:AcrR family transcriptional regulator
VADIADACGFSAANVYRYFSSRSVMLDTLASHYLHETERAALACAIRNSSSARDRLSGLLTGLNTALMIFAVRAAGQPVACRCHGGAMAVLHPL